MLAIDCARSLWPSRENHGSGMTLAFLDLWQHDADITSQPAPSEGTYLPSWWELHGHDFLVVVAVLAAVALLAGLLLIRWRLFDLFIEALAGVVRTLHQARRAMAFVRARVLERLGKQSE